jgi:cytochrome d ubiquinol oxidase subunit I
MELDSVFLSRLQFAFVVSFHIISSLHSGLAAWLATIKGVRLKTGNPILSRRSRNRGRSWATKASPL